MALLKWSDGDTITERSANNKGIRKGTEAEIAAIASVDNELGDVTYNTTVGSLQVQVGGGATDTRGNAGLMLLGADSTEVSQINTTPVQKKDIDFIKSAEGFRGNTITIVAMIKTDANTGTLMMEVDGGPTDEITLTTTSTSYEKVTGTYDATGLSNNAVHTLEFYLYTDNAAATVSLKQLEVYGI